MLLALLTALLSVLRLYSYLNCYFSQTLLHILTTSANETEPTTKLIREIVAINWFCTIVSLPSQQKLFITYLYHCFVQSQSDNHIFISLFCSTLCYNEVTRFVHTWAPSSCSGHLELHIRYMYSTPLTPLC